MQESKFDEEAQQLEDRAVLKRLHQAKIQAARIEMEAMRSECSSIEGSPMHETPHDSQGIEMSRKQVPQQGKDFNAHTVEENQQGIVLKRTKQLKYGAVIVTAFSCLAIGVVLTGRD